MKHSFSSWQPFAVFFIIFLNYPLLCWVYFLRDINFFVCVFLSTYPTFFVPSELFPCTNLCAIFFLDLLFDTNFTFSFTSKLFTVTFYTFWVLYLSFSRCFFFLLFRWFIWISNPHFRTFVVIGAGYVFLTSIVFLILILVLLKKVFCFSVV